MPPLRAITPSMRRCKSASGTACTCARSPSGESAKQVGQLRLQDWTISIRARQVESFSNSPPAGATALRPSVPREEPSAEQQLPPPPPQHAFSGCPWASQ